MVLFECRVGGDEQKTDVVMGDYNPEWNKKMTFHENMGPNDLIKFKVFDKDRIGEDFIGYAGNKYEDNPSHIGLKREDFEYGVDLEFPIYEVDYDKKNRKLMKLAGV